MSELSDFSERDRVKIIGLEPERFKRDPELYEIHRRRLVGLDAKVEAVDLIGQRIMVSLDSGAIEWFDPGDLEIIKKA